MEILNQPNATWWDKRPFTLHLTREQFATLRSLCESPATATKLPADKVADLFSAVLYETEYRGRTGQQWADKH
jgi:hypothetical protein